MSLKTGWNPELYNEKHAFVYNYGEALIDVLQPTKGEFILDIGCGSGQLTQRIFEKTGMAMGIDNSSDMIRDASLKFPDVRFEVRSADNFHFDDTFDAIFSNAALHWVTNYKAAIRCMYGSLKKGGRLALEFGGKGNVQTIVNQLRRSLKQKGYVEQSSIDNWYFPSIGEYTSALEAEGFRVLVAKHFDRPTELADEATGIMDWLSMFAADFFKGVRPDHIEEIKEEVQDKLKDGCFINGKWMADYKRIQILALKSSS